MTASLPPGKREDLLEELEWFATKRRCAKRQLSTLFGKLSFACKVVPGSCIFLRRLIDRSTTVKRVHNHLCVTKEVHRDIAWSRHFMPSRDGVSLFLEDRWSTNHDMALYTDAAGSAGYGAYWDGRWLQQRWSHHMLRHSIAWKELYTILVVAMAWGLL